MESNTLISLIISIFAKIPMSSYKRIFKRYHIEDLNSSEREEAAKYFTKRGWKCIEDLVMRYDEFIDKEFIQNRIFSNLIIEKRSQGLVLNFLNNLYEWKIRFRALILVKKATINCDIEGNIIGKVKEMSKYDSSRENRITAYDVLVEKLSEESIDYLLWGIENDSQNGVKMNCLHRLNDLEKKDQRVIEILERTYGREEERGNAQVIGELFEIAGEMKIREFYDHLIKYLDNGNEILSGKTAIALLKICDDKALDPIKEKCLTIHDQSYRKKIIEDGFWHKKGSQKAKDVLKSHLREYPDDENIVIPVLAKLFEQEGGTS